MCGLPVIDLQDWQRHTDYTGEFERKAGSHKVRAGEVRTYFGLAGRCGEAEERLLSLSL